MPQSRIALFPGTFDPFTLGHLDIAKRAVRVFDGVEITVAANAGKESLLSVEERAQLAGQATSHLPGIVVVTFEGLLVDHARSRGACVLVRGLRHGSDLNYEAEMAFANGLLHPELETVFFLTSASCSRISSTIVRDVYRRGGDIRRFVPPAVAAGLDDVAAASP